MPESTEQTVTVNTDATKYLPVLAQGVMLVFYGAVMWVTSGQHTADIAQLRHDHVVDADKLQAEHSEDMKEVRQDLSNLRSRVSEINGMIMCQKVGK